MIITTGSNNWTIHRTLGQEGTYGKIGDIRDILRRYLAGETTFGEVIDWAHAVLYWPEDGEGRELGEDESQWMMLIIDLNAQMDPYMFGENVRPEESVRKTLADCLRRGPYWWVPSDYQI